MNNKKRGIGLWVVVLVCVFIGIIVSEGWNLLTTSDYSYSDFQQDIQTKAEQIEDVVISPNKETPTGMISVEWKNSSKEESFYVTDVNQVKEWLESVNYTDYKETDVINREGWFYNNGALLVLGGIFLWFLFSFINSQQSGGGNKMTDFGSPIYAPECFAEDGNFKTFAIGTGPYRIIENKLNSHVKIERYDNYWGEKGKIKTFIVRKIPNTDTRYAALKSGEIDGVTDLNAIPPFLAEELKKDSNFVVYKNKSTMVRYLALNGTKFPFNDVRMRQAVSLAIDRQDLVNALYMGYAIPTVNILNYCSPGYKEFPVRHDLQEAKRLAHEVLGDKRVEIVYGINGAEPLQKGEAEIIAYWLKDIGLDVKIRVLEYATLLKMIRKGECNIVRLQKGLANGDPYTALYPFVMPDGALNKNNSVAYENDEIVELMNEVKHTTNEQKRREIFNRIQEIAVEEQPVVPLFNDMAIAATSSRIKNYGVINKIELVTDDE